MDYEIRTCSPKAIAKIESYIDEVGITLKDTNKRRKYPFEELKIGQCFVVPIDLANISSLRIMANRKAHELNKKFTVLMHRAYDCVEVARIK